MAEIIEDEGERAGCNLVREKAQPENSEPAKKPARKGKGKKGTAATEDTDK